MKIRLLTIILAAALLLSFSACGESASDNASESAEPVETAVEAASVAVIDTGDAVGISLADGASAADGTGVEIDGDTVTITEGGNYVLSGSLTDGQIVVGTDKDSDVILTLAGVSISCSHSAAIYVVASGTVTINLEAGTDNQLAVSGDYVQTDDNTVDAAIFSKSDLVLTGTGALSIDAEYGHGIVSKDSLVISGGTYTINAESHGISGKDSVTITAGMFDITCGKDGIHASNTDGDDVGWVTISGGTFTIAAGDDGIHAETALTISGGSIDITESYEGLEGKSVTIEDGVISITASDDGINAAGGDGSAGWGDFQSDDSCFISISGGEITVNASGDGLDSNGNLYVSGGTVYVSGPVASDNGALDYNGEATITGGVVVAAGSSGMAENFGQNSTQGTILYNLSAQQAAGTQITLSDASGNVIVDYTPEKQFQSVVISTPDISSSGTYTLTVGTGSYEITMTGVVYGNSGMGGMPGDMGGGHGGGAPGTMPDDGSQPSGTMPDGRSMSDATTSATTSSADA